MAADPENAAYLEALGRRDMTAALAAIESQRAAGMTLTQIATEIIGPSQVAVGSRWQSAEWTVADEHAASSISEAVVHLLGSAASEPASDRPPVVLACAEREWHTLPALLTAVALRDHGWRVLYLGASMPADHLGQFLRSNRPLALAISCSLPLNLPGIRRQAAEAHALGLPVLAGGRAFGIGDLRARALGVDAVARAGVEASRILEEWVTAPPPLNHRHQAEPGPALADALREDRDRLVERTFQTLRSQLPDIAAYDSRQRLRTLEDLGYTIDFLATAVDIGDPSVLTDYLGWLEDVLRHRGIPARAVGRSLLALQEVLDEHPEACQLLSQAAMEAGLGSPDSSNGSNGRRAAPGALPAARGRSRRRSREFDALVPAIGLEWERRAMINAGALAVAEALAGIEDPVEAATIFTRRAAEELGLATSVVTQPIAGEPATLGSAGDPFWTRHPAASMAEVQATLADGRVRGFRAGGRDLLVMRLSIPGPARTVLVAPSPPGTSAGDAAVAVTALSKVLATALRAAHLEQNNRSKAAFLSVIGHELRTPLSSVLGYAELLGQNGVAVLGAKRMKQVERIQAGGARLLRLVDNVLDLVELESGLASGRPEVLPLKALLEKVAAGAPQGPAQISIRIRCNRNLRVEAVHRHLERALVNVLANAVQFSPPGGIVDISVHAGRSGTSIRVRDQGPGIDPQQLSQLGQPFLQLSRGSRRTHQGLGLGLATARAHLLAMGASFRVQSAPGRGTTVTLVLPGTASEAAAPAASAQSLPDRPAPARGVLSR